MINDIALHVLYYHYLWLVGVNSGVSRRSCQPGHLMGTQVKLLDIPIYCCNDTIIATGLAMLSMDIS